MSATVNMPVVDGRGELDGILSNGVYRVDEED